MNLNSRDFLESRNIRLTISQTKQRVTPNIAIEGTSIPDLSYQEQLAIAEKFSESLRKTEEVIRNYQEQLASARELKLSLLHSASGYNHDDKLLQNAINSAQDTYRHPASRP